MRCSKAGRQTIYSPRRMYNTLTHLPLGNCTVPCSSNTLIFSVLTMYLESVICDLRNHGLMRQRVFKKQLGAREPHHQGRFSVRL